VGELLHIQGAEATAIMAEFENTLLAKKASSIDADRNAVSHFFKWHGLVVPDATAPFRYIEHAKKNLKHSNKTIRRALVTLRRVFEPWGLHKDFTMAMRRVPISSTPERRIIRLIPEERLFELLTAFDLKTVQGRRDQCLIALMIGGALRISEALALTLEDIKKTLKGTTYVRLNDTKANVPAHQALVPEMAEIVNRFLAERSTQSSETNFFITTYQENSAPTELHWDRRNATEAFYRACRRIKLKASPHSCRATAITMLLKRGIQHREVKDFSRHKSVAMVEVYDKREFGLDECVSQKLSFMK
jgi:integrase